jgi:hypothetical protein
MIKGMIVTFVMTFLVTFLGCNPVDRPPTSELRVFQVQKSDLMKMVNDKDMPSDVDLTRDKTILNRDYPIEVALYRDGRWYYDLPNLDTGSGTWKIEDGMIKLYAQRRLFDMYIEVVATEEGADKVALKFRDRFGPRILETEKMNMP